MFRPQIQKTSTLFLIALFNLFMVYLATTSTVQIKKLGLGSFGLHMGWLQYQMCILMKVQLVHF